MISPADHAAKLVSRRVGRTINPRHVQVGPLEGGQDRSEWFTTRPDGTMPPMNAWFLLIAAILLEVIGTTCLKLSQGMTRPWPVVGVVVSYLSAFGLLSLCLKTLEVGVAYALWSGLGTAVIAVLGVLVFGESVTWTKGLGLVLIIAGAILLHGSPGLGAH